MKKLLSIILTCVLTLSTMIIPVSADEIYYPCYIGTWTNTDSGTPVKLEISRFVGNSMNFEFQYGQFAVYVSDAKIDGTKVYGKYHEVWDDGVNWDNYVMDGTITLDLGDGGIWLDWTGTENGSSFNHGFMMTNSSFYYQTIKDSDTYKVVLNGQQLSFDQNPVILNDRVLVPMRAIFEALGAEVDWLPARGYRVVAYKENKEVTLAINSTNMVVNKNTMVLDAPAILYNDRTLVPVRAVSEAFDADVSWDGNTKTVNISTDKTNQTTNVSNNTVDYSSYKGVWQQFARIDTDVPATELVINSISGNQVNFDILMYRLAGYYNQTATINSDGVMQFDTVANEYSNDPIHGNIKLGDNKVVLTITSSEFSYVSPQTIEFNTKSNTSVLK